MIRRFCWTTVSISWAEVNSTATPSWKCRTTRARMRPSVTGVPIAVLLSRVRDAGLALLAADGSGQSLLGDVDLTGPHAWVMGNEAWGLESDVRDACDTVVRVPIHGKAESLNLAMAATLCLYASAAEQRDGPRSG